MLIRFKCKSINFSSWGPHGGFKMHVLLPNMEVGTYKIFSGVLLIVSAIGGQYV